MKTLDTKRANPIGLAFVNPMVAVMKIDRRLFLTYALFHGASVSADEIRSFINLQDPRKKVAVIEGLASISSANLQTLSQAGVRVVLLDTPVILNAVGIQPMDVAGSSRDGTYVFHDFTNDEMTERLKPEHDLSRLCSFADDVHDKSKISRLDRAITPAGVSHGRDSLDAETAVEISAALTSAVYSYIFGASQRAAFIAACNTAIHAGADPAVVRIVQRKLRNRKEVVSAAWRILTYGRVESDLEFCTIDELASVVQAAQQAGATKDFQRPRWVSIRGTVSTESRATANVNSAWALPANVVSVLKRYGVSNPSMSRERFTRIQEALRGTRNT